MQRTPRRRLHRLRAVNPRAGALVGFDLQVNDATGGTRTAATTWHDPTGQSYLNTSRWGAVGLGS
ncbi:sugar-binding protein [Plantactinospora soyae]|uniref:sugar-binding protein n=1 Tax=Plantactinospora soyae TaxID=1544732 RepID=UPI001CEF015B